MTFGVAPGSRATRASTALPAYMPAALLMKSVYVSSRVWPPCGRKSAHHPKDLLPTAPQRLRCASLMRCSSSKFCLVLDRLCCVVLSSWPAGVSGLGCEQKRSRRQRHKPDKTKKTRANTSDQKKTQAKRHHAKNPATGTEISTPPAARSEGLESPVYTATCPCCS